MDGEHLRLRVGVDKSSINTSASQIQSAFSKLGKTIAAAFTIKAFADFAKSSIELASDVEEVQNVVDVSFGDMKDQMEAFANTAIEKFGISALTAKRTGSTYMAMAKGMGITGQEAADMALNLTGLSADMASFYNVSQKYADIALKSVFTGETETLKQYGIVMTQTNLQEFARQKGITKSIQAMTQQEQTMLRYQYVMKQTALAQGDFARTQDSWANQTRILGERWNEVKIQFGETFKVLATLVLPTINQMLTGLSKVAQILQQAMRNIGLMSGKQVDTTEKAASNIEQSVQNQEDLAEATKKANKEIKGQVAGFDEVNQITKDTADETAGGAMSYSPFESAPNGWKAKGDDVVSEVDSTLSAIMSAIGGALAAVGIILLCFGNIPLGIGFIVAGAGLFAVTAFAGAGGAVDEEVSATITSVMGIVGGALVGIGAILIALGSVAMGIGFIIAGAALFGVAAYNIVEFSGDKVKDTMNLITAIAAGAMLALGVMLLVFGGVSPLGIALIVAGAILLVETAVLNSDAMPDDVKKTISIIMAIVGAAVLVLGIILLCFGVIPLGLALLAAGAVSLVTVIAANKNAIVDWIKGIWKAIKDFWNDNIAQIFTAKFWGDKMAKIGDGIKKGAKAVLNGLIWLANSAIDGLNFILTPIRGIIYGVSKAFGKKVSFDDIKIPHIPKLARGAVLPANKPFLAQLGDQKNGRNLEAPESLLRDIYAEGNEVTNDLLRQLISAVQKSPIVVSVDSREIARANRTGESLLGKQYVRGDYANAY